jgi:translation initiation factor 2 subunit 1
MDQIRQNKEISRRGCKALSKDDFSDQSAKRAKIDTMFSENLIAPAQDAVATNDDSLQPSADLRSAKKVDDLCCNSLDPKDPKRVDVSLDKFAFRFYRNRFPEVNEVVVVKVIKLEDVGAYVKLLEYNNINALILRSEFSKKRIRSVKRLIKEGDMEVVSVLRVDSEKGYIDLSKSRVNKEDIARAEDKYKKSKTVHSVLAHVADLTKESYKMSLEELYERVGWPLYDQFGHAYDAFRMMLRADDFLQPSGDLRSPKKVFDGIAPEVRDLLMLHIRRRFTPPAVKVRADIDVRCFTEEGVDAIIAALSAGEALSTPELSLNIRLISPPTFVLSLETLEKEAGLELVCRAVEVIKAAITAHGGKLDVKLAPKVVTSTDESQLNKAMEEAAKENEEIDGDEAEDVDSLLPSAPF